MRSVKTRRLINCRPDEDEFRETDYDWLCSPADVEIIDRAQLQKMINDNDTLLIDVREVEEKPEVDFKHQKIPLSDFENQIENIAADKIVCFCQTGKRSVDAARMLIEKFGQAKKVYSLKDGVLSLHD